MFSIADAYKRARHSRGYGVHSPFAFKIVDLLRLRRKYAFNAADEISDLAIAAGGVRLRREALRFHRICAMKTGGTIFIDPDAPRSIALAALLASADARVTKDPDEARKARTGYFMAKNTTPAQLVEILRSNCETIWLNGFSEPQIGEVVSSIETSLVLLGTHNSILFKRDEMHPVCYTVNL